MQPANDPVRADVEADVPALNLAARSATQANLPTFLSADRKYLILILIVSLVALVFAGIFAKEVLAAEQGPQKMRDISRAVQEGSAAYLSR